jgi:hypothetical protein
MIFEILFQRPVRCRTDMDIAQMADHMPEMFGVGKVSLPDGMDRPRHWIDDPGDWGDGQHQTRQAWRAWIEEMRRDHPGEGWDEVPLPDIEQ